IEKTKEIIEKCFINLSFTYNDNTLFSISISGSAGMGIATSCDINFIQEVFATRIAAKKYIKNTDCIIELGGEDAKILFLTGATEVRMNGSCAGGTGAFIDQMATLLNITPSQMNEEAKDAEKIYTIASRCGVFAKSDIQPLLNQGAKKCDITSSIFYAVCNQTIAGLAQGRPICGNVVYLGGPLTFLSSLRNSFDKTLKTTGILPENSLYFVALGAALGSVESKEYLFNDKTLIINKFQNYFKTAKYNYITPLFSSKEEYTQFKQRHKKAHVEIISPENYVGNAYLGIDAGSTTVKAVIIDESYNILSSFYKSNNGNPVPIIKTFLEDFYCNYPNITIKTATSTGYGEDIIKNALSMDYGIVETMAHFQGASHFMSDVEFIIDIGGQDIKCFKIDNGIISDIFLNEACSSGCGSFLQTFANALGYNIETFAKLGLFADKP
ncbi:MAG: BadF/BadG/BcrA/BcrD ATPase family protein, partial [Clostridia bacterium]